MSTPAPVEDSRQADLPGLAEAFRGVGIDNLPLGVAELKPREQRFCLEYLRTGLWSHSANVAGYADPEKNAGKLRKNTGIMSFLARASTALTEETKQIVIRNEERSRALHTLLAEECNKPETTRSTDKIAKLSAAVSRVDSLLAALKGIGRVSGLHVTGDVSHTHEHQAEVAITLPATALPVLAQMRRDVVVERSQQPLGAN